MEARPFIKRILTPVLQPVARWYFSKERKFRYKDLKIKVYPGVFHPGFFFSTKILLEYLQKQDMEGKSFLEPGAGTGVLSVLAAKMGAEAWATDLNPVAVKNIRENARLNSVNVNVLHSNLLENLPSGSFDLVLINPPYYPRNPSNDRDLAWFCGKDFEFFHRLFSQLSLFYPVPEHVVMILSEDCNIERIKSIAGKYGLRFRETGNRKIWGERNYLFQVIGIEDGQR